MRFFGEVFILVFILNLSAFQISLVLIDEVHLLNEARGSVLEAGVVSRVRVVSKLTSMKQVRVSCVFVSCFCCTLFQVFFSGRSHVFVLLLFLQRFQMRMIWRPG